MPFKISLSTRSFDCQDKIYTYIRIQYIKTKHGKSKEAARNAGRTVCFSFRRCGFLWIPFALLMAFPRLFPFSISHFPPHPFLSHALLRIIFYWFIWFIASAPCPASPPDEMEKCLLNYVDIRKRVSVRRTNGIWYAFNGESNVDKWKFETIYAQFTEIAPGHIKLSATGVRKVPAKFELFKGAAKLYILPDGKCEKM